jgi:hypothetical protein
LDIFCLQGWCCGDRVMGGSGREEWHATWLDSAWLQQSSSPCTINQVRPVQTGCKNLRTRTRSGVDRSDMHHRFSNSFYDHLACFISCKICMGWCVANGDLMGILLLASAGDPACLHAWDMQYMGDDESNDKEVVEDARASESRSFTLLLELQVCHSSTTTSLHSKTRWFSWPHSIWPYGN